MAGKDKAGRIKVLLAFILLFGPAILLIIMATRGCEHKFDRLENYGSLNGYSFTDFQGKRYTNTDFEDKIVLIANIQETCPEECGIAFWHLDQQIYQMIRTNQKNLGHVKIITFATDADGNPVESLDYVHDLLVDNVEEYDPSIWILAKGESKIIYDIESNDLNLKDLKATYVEGDASKEIMLLVDRKNQLRMALNGHTEGMIRQMKECVALLEKEHDQDLANKK